MKSNVDPYTIDKNQYCPIRLPRRPEETKKLLKPFQDLISLKYEVDDVTFSNFKSMDLLYLLCI